MDALIAELSERIVGTLGLEDVRPEDVDPDAPLFGEGLGLDSIDALELVLEIERTFGVSIGDEHIGKRVLHSVNSIAEFIEPRRQPGS